MKYLLGFVMTLFCGILIWVYVVAKNANPVFLDKEGHPIAQQAR